MLVHVNATLPCLFLVNKVWIAPMLGGYQPKVRWGASPLTHFSFKFIRERLVIQKDPGVIKFAVKPELILNVSLHHNISNLQSFML